MRSDDDFTEIEAALNAALEAGDIEPEDYQATAERAMSARGFIYERGARCTCPAEFDAANGHHFSCGWVEP